VQVIVVLRSVHIDLGGEQNVAVVAILELACAPKDASRRKKVLKHRLMGKKGVAVRPGDTGRSVMSVRCAALLVVEEAPCDASVVMAKQPSCA
jgi:hypothetical protein